MSSNSKLSLARGPLQIDRVADRDNVKLSQIPIGREQHAYIFILWRPNFGIGRAK